MSMRQDDEPLISVLMGVLYRRESVNLLERAIRSIQNQTYSNWELLICDDGSTETAWQYLNEIATQDERIHLIRSCKKTDLASKLNWCLAQAKGSYIARMDDDDWSDPQRFEKQLCALEYKPAIAFVGSNVRLWRDEHVVGVWELPEQPRVRDFLFVQPFVHPTLMFRRKALEAVGGILRGTPVFRLRGLRSAAPALRSGIYRDESSRTVFSLYASGNGQKKANHGLAVERGEDEVYSV